VKCDTYGVTFSIKCKILTRKSYGMEKILKGIGDKLKTETKRKRTHTKLCYGAEYLAGHI